MDNKKLKSWVWQYAVRQGNKALCTLCEENKRKLFSTPTGTTSSIGNHLKNVHGLIPPLQNLKSKNKW